MQTINRLPVRWFGRRFTSAMVALSAAAGLAATSGRTLAQTCTTSVQVTPNVIYTGQSASVDVLTHFPSNFYAWASAQFDVRATHPMWTYASSGAIAGSDVLGMNVWQSHAPQSGNFANPANPYRVWRGVFTPVSTQPALVEIKAEPSAIAVYPNRLTPSWIAGDPKGDSDWLLVNPLRIGRWMAAPGRGTKARVGDDVVTTGKIITAENPSAAILIGLLLPAVQKVEETQVGVRFEGRPASFAARVDLDGIPGEAPSLRFTQVVMPDMGDLGAYSVVADLAQPDGTPVTFNAFLGNVRVAAGEMRGDVPSLWVDRVPDTITTRVARDRGLSGGRTLPTAEVKLPNVLISSYSTSGHAASPLRLVLTDGRIVEADTVVVAVRRTQSGNNLKQIGLACHTFEATGVQKMTIVPGQAR